MARKIGWKEESAWGTNPLTTPASDTVQYFGVDDYDREHPWHEQSNTLLTQNNELRQVDAIPGMKKLGFKHKTNLVDGSEWLYALGKKTGNAPTVFTIGSANWKSRAVYSEIGDDVVTALGCYTENFDFIADIESPIITETTFKGKKVVTDTKITTATNPVFRASLNSTKGWGWHQSNTLTYNSVSLGNIKRIHVGIHNVLDEKTSIMSDELQEIERLGCFVLCDFDCWLDGTANDLIAKFRAAFSEGATNNFKYKFLRNTSYYQQIEVHNLKFESVKIPVTNSKYVAYHVVGVAYYDGSNEPITVTVNDGGTY
jgi:hypothetical protein